ncbi:MAG: hypothetical protein LBH16_12070 [Treponema sp.]|nr:hypothetical protein [Treponema sp.]
MILLCFFCVNAFCQNETQNEKPADTAQTFPAEPEIIDDSPKADSIFIINSVNFNVTGFTRTYALMNKGEFVTGYEISGKSELEKYIKDKTQLLLNERVLEKVAINYVTGKAGDDGKYPVDLVIDIKDTWNIVAIPRPMWSTNTGLDITLKARDYNFLGTMSPLRLDVGYKRDEEQHDTFLLMLDSNIPFRLFKLNWNFKFVNNFEYRPDTDEPFYYQNTTGLSVELPVKFTTIKIGFDESFLLNDENNFFLTLLYGDFQEGYYFESSPFISWEIPTGLEVFKWGELIITPRFSAVFSHAFSEWPLDEHRIGPVLTFRNLLGFARVDWIDNFQKGLDVSVDNSFKYDYYRSTNENLPWWSTIKISGKGHFILTDFFGISSRIMYRHSFYLGAYPQYWDIIYPDAADVLRGIPDRSVKAQNMLSLNCDFPLRVLRFSPSRWFNKSWMRVFNFDFHLSPVIDMALYHDPVNNIDFGFKNFLASGGLEAIVFPEFFRSLYLRFSIGWNLSDFSGGRNREIYIGTDFHF